MATPKKITQLTKVTPNPTDLIPIGRPGSTAGNSAELQAVLDLAEQQVKSNASTETADSSLATKGYVDEQIAQAEIGGDTDILNKLSYGGQSYLFAKNNYDFIWNSTTAGNKAAKSAGSKTVTTFGRGIVSFSHANTATAPTLFENPIYLDDGEGNLTAASDVNTWSDGDVFEVRVADVEVGGVSGIKTIMKKVPYLKRGRLEVSGTTVTINDANPNGTAIDLVAGPFDIKSGAHYEIHTTRLSGSFPVVVSVDDDDSVVDKNSTNQSGLFTFSAGAKKFYVHCYNMNKNDLSVREIITYGGDDNYKAISAIVDEVNAYKKQNHWFGKNAIAFGASGTFGKTNINYPSVAADILGINMSNHAGAPRYYDTQKTEGTVTQIGLSANKTEYTSTTAKSWEDYFKSDLDLVIFGGGDTGCISNNGDADKALITNLVLPLAEGQHFTYSDNSSLESHRDTYIGAIIYLLDKLWTIAPKCRVVFVEDYFFIGSPGDAPKSGKGVEITNLLCQKLHIPCINVQEKVCWNWYNKSEYMVDTVHPNEIGTRKIGEMIAHELLLIS